MRTNVKLVSPTLAPKYEVSPQTVVTVNLSGGQGAQRVAVHEVLTFAQLNIDPTQLNVMEAPVFPSEEIAAVNANGRLNADTRAQKIKKLIDDYTQESADYSKNNQGMEIEDLIIVGVTNWLIENKGFSNRKQADKPYIAPNELLVNSFANTGAVIFMVTGTAVWGF